VLRVIREEEPPRPSTRLSESKETLASISAQRQTEPAKLTKLVRGELDWIVMKALDKDRNRRYEAANSFALDVQHYLGDEPVQACPPGASYRLWKLVRKHRKLMSTVLLFALVLFLSTVVTAWQAVLARQAENQARIDKEAALSAQKRAQDETARAERDAATVRAIADFLGNYVLFLDDTVHPRIKGNEELLVVVNRIAARLDGRFQGQPEVEEFLRDRIAAVYYTLHLYAATKPQLERQLTLYRKLQGEEHEGTLLLMERLAWLYSQLGEYAQAEPLLINWLNAYRRGKGEFPAAVSVPETLRSLAKVYLGTGKYDLAEKTLLDNLRTLQAEEGEAKASLADEMITLGDVYKVQGKYEQAEAYYLKSWKARGPKYFNGSQTMEVLASLADLYWAQRKYQQVEMLLHPEEGWGFGFRTEEPAARGLDALGASRLARKKYLEAEKGLRRSVEIWQEVFPDGWRHFNSLSLLGGSILGQKKYADAEPLLLRGYQGMKERMPQIPPHETFRVSEALERLTRLYEAMGKKDKADEWRKKGG
jgi:non-specific serine/threonine protein kinase/serine/threonine-protein kinase